jgi:hypothetical protein
MKCKPYSKPHLSRQGRLFRSYGKILNGILMNLLNLQKLGLLYTITMKPQTMEIPTKPFSTTWNIQGHAKMHLS